MFQPDVSHVSAGPIYHEGATKAITYEREPFEATLYRCALPTFLAHLIYSGMGGLYSHRIVPHP